MGLHVPLPAPARQQPRARAQVRAVIWRLFELAPSAAAAAVADPAAVRAIIEPLGLAPKRVPMLQRFSREYLDKDVRTHSPVPRVLFSQGKCVKGSSGQGRAYLLPCPPHPLRVKVLVVGL